MLENKNKSRNVAIIGLILLIVGLIIAIFLGGLEGFAITPFQAFSYILGMILAFIGFCMLVIVTIKKL